MHLSPWLRTLSRRLFVRPSSSWRKRRPMSRRVQLGLEHLDGRDFLIDVFDPFNPLVEAAVLAALHL